MISIAGVLAHVLHEVFDGDHNAEEMGSGEYFRVWNDVRPVGETERSTDRDGGQAAHSPVARRQVDPLS
jgi:hypothetical protein